MKSLKATLIFLVIVLVAVIAVGGSMVGFNHSGHQMADSNQKAESDKSGKSGDSSNESKKTSNQNHINDSSSTIDMANTNMIMQNGSLYQLVYGNQAQQAPMGPVVVAQVPPEEYLKKMQEAMSMVKDATGLMASAPSSAVGMDKIHEGIYKMAQATTLMDQAMTGMQKEIDKAQYTPSINTPYPNGGYPVNPYFNPYFNQVNPNQSSSTQDVAQNQQHSGMNHGTGIDFNLQSVTYLIYGVLILSLFGIISAVIGFIGNLFKPARVEEQRGESVVG